MTKTSTGLDENVAGLLCYIGWWVSGLIFLLIEKENKFVRYMILMDSDTNHAMCFGHSVVVNESGCESLSKRSLDLVVRCQTSDVRCQTSDIRCQQSFLSLGQLISDI